MGYIRNIVLKVLLRLNQRKNNYEILLNVNQEPGKEGQRRVLLCYLDYVASNIRLLKNETHTNFSELNALITALMKGGLTLDICSFYANGIDEIMQQRTYDYIIGFGEIFRKAAKQHPNAKKILYMTENPYHIAVRAERERIAYFEERTGRKVDLYRSGKAYEDKDLELADAIICLGEKRHLSHLCIPVEHITPTGLRNREYKYCFDKKEKTNFLVWGGNGIIHKGIDLLIEVFRKHPKWKLNICGAGIEKALRRYGIDVPENVRLYGYVNIQSEVFCELADRCVFVLLPSCSEACATGLLTCMRHGLIPITSRDNGMEQYEQYCYFFDGYRVEEIEEKIQEMLQYETLELNQIAKKIYMYSDKEFALPRFYSDVSKIFEKVLQ